MQAMKQILAVVLIFFGTLKAQTWQQLGDFPGTARDDGASFVINNKAYFGTGYQLGWTTTRDFYSLDLASHTWTTGTPLPAGMERQAAHGFSYKGKGYIFGGLNGSSFLNDLWCFDESASTWTQLPSKPGGGVCGANYFLIDSIVYFCGGSVSITALTNEVWSYNISTATWTQKNNFPFSLWRGGATGLNGAGYMLFGKDAANNFFRTLYRYSPVADTWTAISTFPLVARSHAAIHNLGNEIIVFGGQDSLNNAYNDLWAFDTQAQSWSQKTSLPSFGRKEGFHVVNNSSFYYTAGLDPSNNRITETWTAVFPVGIKEIPESDLQIKLAPNPAKDFCRIFSCCNVQFRYSLSDMQGRVVREGINSETIDLSRLEKGVYFVTVLAGDQKRTEKLIVQ